MAQLAALLRTDLSRMAEEVRRAGRGKDTMLAHITPKEAALDRKSTRLNSSHVSESRMPSSA